MTTSVCTIESRPIGSIQPYHRNPRRNDDAVEAVAQSIAEFGFRQPIVVDPDGVIIVGHTRYKAAIRLGLDTVPIHVADLPQEKAKAYRLADNATNEIASWDDELMPLELQDLQTVGFDLSKLGFSQDALDNWLDGQREGQVDPDAIPEPPDDAITQPGDIWILGDHRLMCGDSASPADLDRLLDGAEIHLVNTDPPYGVKVEPRSNNAIAAGHSSFTRTHHQNMDAVRHPEKNQPTTTKLRAKDRPLANDFLSDEDFERMLDGWFGNIARVLAPGRGFYIWGGFTNCANYPPVLKKHGLYFSQAIIWMKEHPVLTRKDFMTAHEWAFYGWRQGAAHQFYAEPNIPDVWRLTRGEAGSVALGRGIRVETPEGSRLDILPPANARKLRQVPITDSIDILTESGPSDVWSVKKISPQKMIHLTEKPVELAVRAITYSSKPGENVLDLFGGSGSTLIACEQMGRKAYLMELDALYCDVIVKRWEEFTGGKAQRILGGGA